MERSADRDKTEDWLVPGVELLDAPQPAAPPRAAVNGGGAAMEAAERAAEDASRAAEAAERAERVLMMERAERSLAVEEAERMAEEAMLTPAAGIDGQAVAESLREIEDRIDEALAVAEASARLSSAAEEGVGRVGRAAVEAAEQARRASEIAAEVRAQAAEAQQSAERSAASAEQSAAAAAAATVEVGAVATRVEAVTLRVDSATGRLKAAITGIKARERATARRADEAELEQERWRDFSRRADRIIEQLQAVENRSDPGVSAQVREVRAGEESAVLPLYEWLFAPPGSVPPRWDPERATAALSEAIESLRSAIFVAEEDGDLVGICSAYLDLNSVRYGLRCWVEDLAVDPERRSLGTGKALLDAARDWGRERGATHLELDSGIARTEAHRFYEREQPSWTGMQYAWEL